MRLAWLDIALSSFAPEPTVVGPLSSESATGSEPIGSACGKTSSITRRTGPSAGIRSMASSASLVGVLTSTPPSTANLLRSPPFAQLATSAMSGRSGEDWPPTGMKLGSNANGKLAEDRAASASWLTRSASVSGVKSSLVSLDTQLYGSRRNEKLPWCTDWVSGWPRSS